MNEIFGEENFICEFIWKSKSGGANDSKFIAVDHEYILCYAKHADYLNFKLDKNAMVTTSYNLEDEKGKYALDRLESKVWVFESWIFQYRSRNIYRPAHKIQIRNSFGDG